MYYKILWFDDEHETLEDIKENALLKKIKLIGFKNADDGLKILLNNPNQYDGVLLDGLFFKTSNQSGDAVSGEAFGEVAKVLGNLKAQGNIIPWFIYSGQKSFVKDKNELVNVLVDKSFANGKVFDKNIVDDFEELCSEIIKEADKRPVTNVRHINPELFEIFELGYLPEAVEDNLLELLIKPLPSNNSELKAILTNIRSIHESCLLKLENIKVIPDSKDSFNNIIRHLSGNVSKDHGWKPTSTVYQTREIQNLHEWIYYTCGTYIHNLKDQHYAGYMISNYSVDSLRNGLLEILLWFKKTYEENK